MTSGLLAENKIYGIVSAGCVWQSAGQLGCPGLILAPPQGTIIQSMRLLDGV